MKQILYIFLVALMPDFCAGQNTVLPLWPAQIPNTKTSSQVEKRDTTDVIRISAVQNPELAVFLPSKPMATGQAVVICPGGGYGVVVVDKEGSDIAKWLNAYGIAAVVLKYRLPNPASQVVPHRTPLLDAQRAIRLTRFHANEWNIDTDKIGIMGFSAGGHLASTSGTHFDCGDSTAANPVERLSCRPDFMILMYPVITFTKPYMHQGSCKNLLGENPEPALVAEYSNELQVTAKTPPTFIIHSGDDRMVPVQNSLDFYQALQANDVAAEMHIYPHGGHGFGLALNKGYLSTWTDRCIDWLRTVQP